jgi:hypothetical protein
MALTIEERLARLEKAAEPKSETVSQSSTTQPTRRYDPTAQLTVPPSVRREMTAAVGDKLMADIVKDHLGRPTSLPTVHARSPGKAGSNWKEPAPLKVFGTESLGKKREA